MIDIIKKKRDGFKLTVAEIQKVVDGLVDGTIPDYQISAWLMSIFFNGLDKDETIALTKAMMHSGDVMHLDDIEGFKVDKHSTGGVGDKTTLVLGPLVAAAGVKVAKMSGKGLGHTGGTLDKLLSIPGFQVELAQEDFKKQVNLLNLAVCGQTGNLVPADKKLYALRDVTATVENLSLIASSVMSKKLVSGADGIVIDLKVGHGAFIKSVEQARILADIMFSIAESMHRKLVVIITNMNQPLGKNVGNILELIESINTLKGHGPQDLTDLCIELGADMLVMAGKSATIEEGKATLFSLIKDGSAFSKFVQMVEAQKGDISYIVDPSKFDNASQKIRFISGEQGFIVDIDAEKIGLASMYLGAGRMNKDSLIDYTAGIELLKKTGEMVNKGETIAILHTNNKLHIDKAIELLQKAYVFQNYPVANQALILEKIYR